MSITNGYCDTISKGLDCESDESRLFHHLGWETRLGFFAAVSLTILEMKRLFLLIFEMLVDSRPIRFAGAFMPIIFSFIDVGVGFPVALSALYAIRKHKVQPWYPTVKHVMRRIALILLVCAIFNIVTIILIGQHVNGNADSLRDVFMNAMRFYARNASYKFAIDDLQFDLQCCGYSSYMDWFSFNWQGIDYVDSDGKQEFEVRSVPFSCCNKHAMLPCFHTEMKQLDVKTINSQGCAVVISEILFKIVVVGYPMTTLIMFTQIFLVIFLLKIVKREIPENHPSNRCCWNSKCHLNEAVPIYSSDDSEHSSHPLKGHKQRRMRQPRKFWQHHRHVDHSTTSRCSSPSLLTSTCTTDSSSTSDASSSCIAPKKSMRPTGSISMTRVHRTESTRGRKRGH